MSNKPEDSHLSKREYLIKSVVFCAVGYQLLPRLMAAHGAFVDLLCVVVAIATVLYLLLNLLT